MKLTHHGETIATYALAKIYDETMVTETQKTEDDVKQQQQQISATWPSHLASVWKHKSGATSRNTGEGTNIIIMLSYIIRFGSTACYVTVYHQMMQQEIPFTIQYRRFKFHTAFPKH